MSLRRWVLIAAEMMSLTGGSSFFGADEGSLEVVFFTFGTVFSPVLGLMDLRRKGFRTSLGSGALAGGNLLWSADAAPGIMISGPGRILGSPSSSPCGLGVADLLRSLELFVLPMDRTRLATGSSGSWSMDRLWRLAERCCCASSEPGGEVSGKELCGGMVVVI